MLGMQHMEQAMMGQPKRLAPFRCLLHACFVTLY